VDELTLFNLLSSIGKKRPKLSQRASISVQKSAYQQSLEKTAAGLQHQ
jgi:hypothetical protein